MQEQRYLRNFPSISREDQETLKNKTVCVIGCGGLGGHIAEELARIGIGNIHVIDGDVFSESNLNRQLLCTCKNIGKSKAYEAKKRILAINPNIKVKVSKTILNKSNAVRLLKGSDIVIDALDNIGGRLTAMDACNKLGIYFIHGAISGWCVQASTVAPGSDFLRKIYPENKFVEPPSVLAFAPSVCAGIQVSETIKVLLGKEDTLEGKLLIMDLKSLSFNIFSL